MTLFQYLMKKIFGILDFIQGSILLLTSIQNANFIMDTTTKITRIRVIII